jgi:hypothetical protein
MEIRTTKGNRTVISTLQNGTWASCLFVVVGAELLASRRTADHKTKTGAQRWAAKTLEG